MGPDIWPIVAEKLGYASVKDMWTDLYVTKGMGIAALEEYLDTARITIREQLVLSGIEIRKRGGKKNWKLRISDEQLWQEVEDFGITDVADHHGVSRTTVAKRYKAIRDAKLAAGILTAPSPYCETFGQDEHVASKVLGYCACGKKLPKEKDAETGIP